LIEEQIIPQLFENKPNGAVIRVWSAGCSTGEEAYSLAILLQERIDILKMNYVVQVFATDIDNSAIELARAGNYPASISSDVSEKRLNSFFTLNTEGTVYTIKKHIRNLLVFSEHSIISDPPFSKMDLISCRNVMIYMEEQLQKEIIPKLHYALNSKGFLFLGTSESTGNQSELFITFDNKLKIYQRSQYTDRHIDFSRSSFNKTPSSKHIIDQKRPSSRLLDNKITIRNFAEQSILKKIAPVSVLVNDEGDIYYTHGRTGMYLELKTGESDTNNIIQMARLGLQTQLIKLLKKASREKMTLNLKGLQVKTNGNYTTTNLTILPVRIPVDILQKEKLKIAENNYLYLIIFEDTFQDDSKQVKQPKLRRNLIKSDSNLKYLNKNKTIETLKEEIRAKEEALIINSNEMETFNEELKSANEEMQSINEELQSTNEELETSKEELQSVNEELSTVNSELQNKVDDLTNISNDMNNLMASTGIATIFIDKNIKIMRFTPAAKKIIPLIEADIGRPLADISLNLTGSLEFEIYLYFGACNL